MKPPQRLTNLEAIAKAAQVSVATASLALNDHARVSDRTKLRVRAAAAKLDYIPNQAARRLARAANGRRGTSCEQVGFVIFDRLWHERGLPEAYLSMMRGVEHELASHDAAMVFLRVGAEAEYEKITRLIRAGRVDAWLVTGTINQAVVDLLVGAGAPFVVLGTHSSTLAAHTVDVNYHEAGGLAVERLAAMGHRRIGFLGASMNLAYQQQILAGFQQATAALGVDAADELIVTNAQNPGRSLMRRLEALMKLPKPPTAIFVAEPWQDLRILEVLGERGVRVPGDLSILGTAISPAPGSTDRIDWPLLEVGRAGASLLREIIEQGTTSPRQIRISPTHVAGSTCRSVPMPN